MTPQTSLTRIGFCLTLLSLTMGTLACQGRSRDLVRVPSPSGAQAAQSTSHAEESEQLVGPPEQPAAGQGEDHEAAQADATQAKPRAHALNVPGPLEQPESSPSANEDGTPTLSMGEPAEEASASKSNSNSDSAEAAASKPQEGQSPSLAQAAPADPPAAVARSASKPAPSPVEASKAKVEAQPTHKPAANSRYQVKYGDTLWSIARDHYGNGLDWQKIAQANDITNPKQLWVGRELLLPPAGQAVTDSAQETAPSEVNDEASGSKPSATADPGDEVTQEDTKSAKLDLGDLNK